MTNPRQLAKPAGPDFLCIGLQKAGTLWLYDQLKSAAGVWMPPIKELNYFSGTSFKPANVRALESERRMRLQVGRAKSANRAFLDLFEQGAAPGAYTDAWYISLFSVKDRCLSGDVSPAYATLDDSAVSRIATVLPHSKIILMLRHPVDRAKSALSMYVRKGRFTQDSLASPDELRKIVSLRPFAGHSFPSLIWTRWVERFGADRCRYFFLDDVTTSPEQVRDRIANFLGLDRPKFAAPANMNRKQGQAKYEFSRESEAFLYDYYKDEILRSKELFGQCALNWRTHPE